MTDEHPETEAAHARRRNRAIQGAVASSLASKVGTALLRLVSIPIAYRVLGGETFGIYATVTLAIGTVVLMQCGIGPALTHGLSRATACGNRDLERQYFSTSWFMLLGLSLLGGLIMASLLLFVPLTFFFGDNYAGLEEQMLPALWLTLGIVLLEFMLSHTERAREGYLQVYINNLWGAAGNFAGAIAVAVGVYFFPTIEFLIIAVYGSHVLAKAGNTVHLFLKRRDLLPRLSHFRMPVARELFTDGLAFSVSHTFAKFVELNGCSLILANLWGPKAVGVFMIFSQIATFLLNFIVMFTTPIWPSVVDAFTRRDFPWVRKTARRLRTLVLLYTGAGIAGLTPLGPTLIPIWMGPEMQVTWQVLLAFSLYFLAHAWAHANYSLIIGVGLVKRSAIFALAEALIILVPVYFLTKAYGLTGMFTGMFLTLILISGWIYPLLFVRRLREEEGEPAPTAAASPG